MLLSDQFISILESRLNDTTGVYVQEGADEVAYIASLAQSIRDCLCEPFLVSAKVMPPGFYEHADNEILSGYCIAHRAGYWLVYHPQLDRFYCFWGQDTSNLGAHGIAGSPLYCWSA